MEREHFELQPNPSFFPCRIHRMEHFTSFGIFSVWKSFVRGRRRLKINKTASRLLPSSHSSSNAAHLLRGARGFTIVYLLSIFFAARVKIFIAWTWCKFRKIQWTASQVISVQRANAHHKHSKSNATFSTSTVTCMRNWFSQACFESWPYLDVSRSLRSTLKAQREESSSTTTTKWAMAS